MTQYSSVTGILLAGGKSSRMGRCKAELPWEGTTLICHQTKKLRCLGIEDIIISGYAEPVEGGRYAEDVYRQKGPLGGIHGAMKQARHEHCLVLAVDTPLVPLQTLEMLISEHIRSGSAISVLEQSRGIEPLIGVYEKSIVPLCEQILCTQNTAVRELYKLAPPRILRYDGSEELLIDCNTPAEYAKAAAKPNR